MSFFNMFGTRSLATGSTGNGVPATYSLDVSENKFIESDITATYKKILTDTLERTTGIPSDKQPLLWDNCLQSESTKGLVSLLVDAMYNMSDLYIVYNKTVNVLRKANNTEQTQIQADYKKSGSSTIGVYISFKNYSITDMLKIYSSLEYCVIESLYKSVNISRAVQYKMDSLRSSVSLADSTIAIDQAADIARALREGKDVITDAKDSITTTTPDVGPTEKAISFLDAKRAFILSLPLSYISGALTAGIGSTGEADVRAKESGLKQYFLTIIHPVVTSVFSLPPASVQFKSQDTRQLTVGMELLKTFELATSEILSKETQQAIVARMFDIDATAEKKLIDKEASNDEPDDDEGQTRSIPPAATGADRRRA
jgi:hypothetical protein